MRVPFVHKGKVDANAMVSITEDGKLAIDRDMVTEMKAYAILAELDQSSPQSLSSLSRQAKTDIFTIQREINRLRAQGLVRVMDFRES